MRGGGFVFGGWWFDFLFVVVGWFVFDLFLFLDRG